MTDRDLLKRERHAYECPHCDRCERFLDGATGDAWLIGHIQEEHDDELPAMSNTGR